MRISLPFDEQFAAVEEGGTFVVVLWIRYVSNYLAEVLVYSSLTHHAATSSSLSSLYCISSIRVPTSLFLPTCFHVADRL